ncbi:MAG TPA: right-handed parallel beta-helix repeat-containing protein [Polyangiaceae bacterium]|nr:right-handed parallel beta-helix repeat-containing protein [Polyangiaceae bacterium]
MPRVLRRLFPVAGLTLTLPLVFVLDACRFGYGGLGTGNAITGGEGGNAASSAAAGSAGIASGTGGGGASKAGMAGIDDTAGAAGDSGGAGADTAGTAGAGSTSGTAGSSGTSGTAGNGGSGGTGGKAGSGGTAGAGGGSGTGGVDLVNLVVTTAADEADSGATPASPGQTGFSLREAITFANGQVGHQAITFDAAVTTIGLKAPLPVVQETLDIKGSVELDATANTQTSACLSVASSDVHLEALEIHHCQGEPVRFSSSTSTGNELKNSYIHDNKKAVVVYGDGALVSGCLITFSAAAGLDIYGSNAQLQANDVAASLGTNYSIHDGANGASLLANVSIGGGDGIGLGAITGITIWHSTIVDSVYAGLNVGTATQVDARNNIFIGADTYGVRGADSAFTKLDHNLYFNNTSGNRNSGSLDATSVIGDPLFNDPTNFDYSLKVGSPAINKGADLGVDRNGSSSGLYNGSAPDIGWSEAP